MLHLPVIRWGQAYESLDVADILHFESAEPVVRVSQANSGLLRRDLRKSQPARDALLDLAPDDLVAKCSAAAELFRSAPLTMGDAAVEPDDYVRMQSATTGLPENLCRSNMEKISFVLGHMDEILEALTRGLDLKILATGHGLEDRGVVVSYQAQSPVLGAVLPSNSPGVHTLWLPAIPLQVGLVLKPGSAEPWTPYRVAAAMQAAGIPAESMGLYPGPHDVGGALLAACRRSMVFGSEKTVEQYQGNPGVQVHGPGFSKILIGEDCIDDWPRYVDCLVESVLSNGGRSCINASAIWVPRHAAEIAAALAERLGPVEVKPPDDPQAQLAAFTQPPVAASIWQSIEADCRADGAHHATEEYGPRLVEREHCSYLRPVVVRCDDPSVPFAAKEFMFPCVSVVSCPASEMLSRLGPTLVASAITAEPRFIRDLGDCVQIDRFNVGPIPTNRLNWRQPHEGNIIEFLYRSRAHQTDDEWLAAHTG